MNAEPSRRLDAASIAIPLLLFVAPLAAYLVIPLTLLAASAFYWILVATYGSCTAQGVLLGSWWGLGRLSARRTIVALVASFVLPLTHMLTLSWLTWRSGSFDPIWQDPQAWWIAVYVFFTPFIVSALLCLVARPYGWRWRLRETPVGPPVQLSLQSLLIAVGVAALLMTAMRSLRDVVGALEDSFAADAQLTLRALRMPCWAVGILCGPLAALFASFGPRIRVGGLLLSLLIGQTIAYGVGWALYPRHSPEAAWPEQSGLLTAGAIAWTVTVAALLAGRLGGWRSDRVASTPVSESAMVRTSSHPASSTGSNA